ncbi:YadA family autotransporter adhesin [Lysobacter panacisoli]|nr:YadA-like family protein [Lysobacter panacisoli]
MGANSDATGVGAVAIGNSAKASKGIAVGDGAQAAQGAVVLGAAAQATAIGGSAIGNQSTASGIVGTALGVAAQANDDYSVALGSYSVSAAPVATSSAIIAGRTYNFAGATPTATVSVGGGVQAPYRTITNVAAGRIDASSTDAVNGSELFATNTQVGINTAATNGLAGVLGTTVNPATGAVNAPTYALANAGAISGMPGAATNVVNGFAKVDAALGAMKTSIVNGTVGLVQQDPTTRDITVAKATDGTKVNFAGTAGDRVLTGVADGAISSTSNEAINGSQLYATNQTAIGLATALGGGAVADPVTGTVAAPSYALTNADAITNDTTGAATDVGAGFGKVNAALGTMNTSIANIANGTMGLVQQDATSRLITVAKDTDGTQVSFAGTAGDRVLAGVAAGTADTDAVNVSQLRQIKAQAAGAGERSVKYKWNDTNNDGVIDPGEVDYSVAMLEGAQSTDGGVTDGTSITNLHRGAVSALSTDAINGSQLYGTANSIATHLGGGAAVQTDGTVSAPAYTLANASGGTTTYNNVGDALGNLDQRTTGNTTQINNLDGRVTNIEGDVTDIRNDITNIDGRVTNVEGDVTNLDNRVTNVEGDVTNLTTQINNGGVGLVKQSTPDGVVTVAGSTGGNEVSVAGTGGPRRISGVAPGTQDTDAVNLGQIRQTAAQTLGEANAYTDRRVDDWGYAMDHRIDAVNRQANRGIAAASALVNVTPYVPGHTVLNAGVATYRGEGALGVGVSRWTKDGRVNFNAGVSAAQNDEPIYRVGIGVIF